MASNRIHVAAPPIVKPTPPPPTPVNRFTLLMSEEEAPDDTENSTEELSPVTSPEPIKAKPLTNSFECANCHRDLPKDSYSSSQFKKGPSRKCSSCVKLPSPVPVISPPPKAEQPISFDEFEALCDGDESD